MGVHPDRADEESTPRMMFLIKQPAPSHRTARSRTCKKRYIQLSRMIYTLYMSPSIDIQYDMKRAASGTES